MNALLKLVRNAVIAVFILVALVGAAAMYGIATPTADIDSKREAASKRAADARRIEERNAAAREAGAKTAETLLEFDKRKEDRKKIYSAAFDLGKQRSQGKKTLPDRSFMDNLATEIIASYGMDAESQDLQTQFRAGYAKGFMAGK